MSRQPSRTNGATENGKESLAGGLWRRTIGLRVRWGLRMGKRARLGDHQVNWPWVQPVPSKNLTTELTFFPSPKILSLQRAKSSLLCSLRLPAWSLSLWSSGIARRSRGRAQHWGFEQAQIPSLGKDFLSRLPPCRLTPHKKGHSGREADGVSEACSPATRQGQTLCRLQGEGSHSSSLWSHNLAMAVSVWI